MALGPFHPCWRGLLVIRGWFIASNSFKYLLDSFLSPIVIVLSSIFTRDFSLVSPVKIQYCCSIHGSLSSNSESLLKFSSFSFPFKVSSTPIGFPLLSNFGFFQQVIPQWSLLPWYCKVRTL